MYLLPDFTIAYNSQLLKISWNSSQGKYSGTSVKSGNTASYEFKQLLLEFSSVSLA